jgi:hypothetical protein
MKFIREKFAYQILQIIVDTVLKAKSLQSAEQSAKHMGLGINYVLKYVYD